MFLSIYKIYPNILCNCRQNRIFKIFTDFFRLRPSMSAIIDVVNDGIQIFDIVIRLEAKWVRNRNSKNVFDHVKIIGSITDEIFKDRRNSIVL